MTTTTTKATSTITAAAAAALLIGAAMATTTTSANASDELVAGAAGFALGTVFGAVATQPRVVQPRRRVIVVQDPAPSHALTPAGVTVAHAQWCASRYRSYIWNTNTWTDLKGRTRWCG